MKGSFYVYTPHHTNRMISQNPYIIIKLKIIPWTVNLAYGLSRVPTIFCTMHWYLASSNGRTSLIKRLPPSTTRIRDGELWDEWRGSSNSILIPSLRQTNDGSGLPLGGPHSKSAVSPAATLVSFGSTRKSSRSTENKNRKK